MLRPYYGESAIRGFTVFTLVVNVLSSRWSPLLALIIVGSRNVCINWGE